MKHNEENERIKRAYRLSLPDWYTGVVHNDSLFVSFLEAS
jgi:hypothetical protein